MGTLADSLFTALMSWVRALVSGIWALFSSEHTTVLEFLGKHWLVIALVIIAAGLVIDWIIWLLRWQPYHLWAQRARRLLRIEEPEEEDEEAPRGKARAAVTQGMRYAPAEHEDEWEAGFPPPALELDEQDAQQAMANAESAPDEYAYPGMRYDSPAAENEELSGTRRYSAVRSEGPGAAEVERRRAEIDAWQMQEEARMRAEAERAAREREAYEAEQARLAQEAYEAEQARLAQEAYEAEQARLAQEAYEAEQARLAQEEYERQLAQYEREKAQYEQELARYEQEKAAYDAYMAQQAAEQQAAAQQAAAQQNETAPAAAAPHRRAAGRTYSDYVQGETVGELPDPPEWPQMNAASQTPKEKTAQGGLFGRMARMIEPEEEELVSRTQLPPRVDPHEAYRPAKTPKKKG